MSITFEIKNTAGDVIRRKRINNLDINFFNTAERLIDKGYGLGLEQYYEYNIVFIRSEPFPFIIRNNRCEWHIPVDDITIRDFMTTHFIKDGGVITVNEVGIGVGDPHFYVYELVSWLLVLWPCVANVVTLSEIAKKVSSVYRKLIGKDKKPVLPYEVLELLRTKEEWTMSEIKRLTGIENEMDVEILLLQGNFRKEQEKYVKSNLERDKNNHPLQNYCEYVRSIAKECWGEYNTEYETAFSSVKEAIHYLNCSITNLLLQSELYQTDFFEAMIAIIEAFIDEWDDYVCKGKWLKFVELKPHAEEVYNKEYVIPISIEELVHDLKMLQIYSYHLSEKLEKNG